MRRDNQATTSTGAQVSDPTLAIATTTLDGPSQKRISNRTQSLATGIVAAICLLYLGLVPLGQWQADEYDRFSRLHGSIWQIFASRMQWTLRPWEVLYIAYGLLVNHFHRPLTGYFLGLLWAGFLFCACATAVAERREMRLAVLLSGLGLAAAFLTAGPLFQLFYWPAATVVYLPILSATLLLFLQTLCERQSSRRGRLVCGICLAAAALGGEVGATFVACFALLQALNTLWLRSTSGGDRGKFGVLYWLLPGLIAMAVMLVASRHRLSASEGFFTVASSQLHHPLASAAAAARTFALELVGLTANPPNEWVFIPRVLSRLLIATGVALIWARSSSDGEPQLIIKSRPIAVIGAACVMASFAVLFGSYVHFGTSAGERLETLRRAWFLMAYVAAAVVIVQSGGSRRLAQARSLWFAAPALLIIGVVMPWHVSPLLRQYATYKNMACTTATNFAFGLQAENAAMIFVLPPAQGVISPLELEPGIYSRTAQDGGFNDVYARYILEYFGKQTLMVVHNRPCETPATAQPVP